MQNSRDLHEIATHSINQNEGKRCQHKFAGVFNSRASSIREGFQGYIRLVNCVGDFLGGGGIVLAFGEAGPVRINQRQLQKLKVRAPVAESQTTQMPSLVMPTSGRAVQSLDILNRLSRDLPYTPLRERARNCRKAIRNPILRIGGGAADTQGSGEQLF